MKILYVTTIGGTMGFFPKHIEMLMEGGHTVELSLGNKPKLPESVPDKKYIINEFLYCKEGVFDHLEGFDELLNAGIITEYYQLKTSGARFGEIKSSGDRVAFLTVEAASKEELKSKHIKAMSSIKVIGENGLDILNRDIINDLGEK